MAGRTVTHAQEQPVQEKIFSLRSAVTKEDVERQKVEAEMEKKREQLARQLEARSMRELRVHERLKVRANEEGFAPPENVRVYDSMLRTTKKPTEEVWVINPELAQEKPEVQPTRTEDPEINIRGTPKELLDRNQKHVFYIVAHRRQVPRSARPAIRILGAFPSVEAGEAFFRGLPLGVTPRHHPVGEWLMINEFAGANPVRLREKMSAMLNREETLTLREQLKFDVDLRSHHRGPIDMEHDRRKEAARLNAQQNSEILPREVQRPDGSVAKPKPFPDHRVEWQVSGQNVAVVSWIRDYLDFGNPEPMVLIHRIFENDQEADAWIQNKSVQNIYYLDLDVVAMYGDLFPEDIDYEHITEIYRNEEEQEVMDYRKKNKQELSELQKLCQKHGMAWDADGE